MDKYNFFELGMSAMGQSKRTRKLQNALYLISEAASSALELEDLYRSLHNIIGKLIPAKNFFIALYDDATDTVHFPYYVDELSERPSTRQGKMGLTEYIIRTGQPLLVSPLVYAEMLKKGEVKKIGMPAIDWIGIPLKTAENKVIGALAVQTYTEDIRYTQADTDILSFVSRQVAMVIERKRAEEVFREREEQYRAIVEHSHDAIYIFSEDKTVYANDNFCTLLGISQKEIDTVDLFHYIHPEDLASIHEYINQYQYGCKICSQFETRITNKNGQLKFVELNLNGIVYKGKNAFIWTISDISERKSAEKLQKALYQISEAANSSLDLEKLYSSVHQIIGELILAENCFIAFYDENTDTVEFAYHVDEKDEAPSPRKNGRGLTEQVIKTGQPLFVSKADHMKWVQEGKIEKSGTFCVNWLGVPLKTSKDRVFGVLAVKTRKESTPYTQKDKEILSFVSNQVAMAIRRKQDETRLQYFSFRDSLSGLYNRRYFEEEMRRMDRRREGSVGLIVLDVDGLKLVNDMFGHDSGDILLSNVAKLLMSCFRDQDIVARIGGDEYAVLLHDANQDAVKAACKRVKNCISVESVDSNQPPISLSIGFATSDDPSTPMHELFKQADKNMYREKTHRSKNTRNALVQTMMKLLEEKDFITEGHTERVEKSVVKLGEKCGLTEEKLVDLRLLAQYHDIGKVGILDSILFKPGSLTAEEMKEVQRHSEIGQRIAQSSSDLHSIAELVLKHHEWWNGKGYPTALSGESIPIECRILAIADAYDAMTSDRPYRKAMTHEEAVAELKRYAGIQFDPVLVDKFI